MDILHREGFNFVPISVDKIEQNLFLGSLSAAKDIDTLHRLKITHILTIDTCPLPRNILELKHITTKYIQLSDFPNEDLLSHLDDTEAFLQEGNKCYFDSEGLRKVFWKCSCSSQELSKCLSKGVVLVHCYFGVSRSATVVIACIMKKYGLTYSAAYDRVKQKRNIVFPNKGFVSQLKIYEEMGYKIDKGNMRYKVFRLNIAAHRVKKVKILPQNFIDLIQSDPGLPQSQPELNVYRCKKCRRILASESNLIFHQDKGKTCTKAYFVEPIAWMNVTRVTEGKLHCPKCKHKVGSFSWIIGCQCPCGDQVAPAFYLVPSEVDYTNVIKNVEITF